MSDLTLIEKSRNGRILIQVNSDVGKKWINDNLIQSGYETTTVISVAGDRSDLEDLVKKMQSDLVDVEVL